MDFWLTDDQQALGDMVSAFAADRFALDGLPDAEDRGTVLDRDRWKSLADLGVFSLVADGMGVREAVVVFERLGAGLVPGPLVSTWLASRPPSTAAHHIAPCLSPSTPCSHCTPTPCPSCSTPPF